jgi:RNA polymerase sigma-70 factor (ECF subfamily)
MEEPGPEPPRTLAERIAGGLPDLVRYVRRRMGPELRDKESASDIVQSTARELLRSGRFEFRGEPSFQRWLRVAAENKLKNRARYWRSLGRGADRETLGSDAALASTSPPSQAAVLAEERARLERALGELSGDHRHVVLRVQIDGASYDEVARELGRSPEAVRKLLARALARLSTALRAADAGSGPPESAQR